MIATEPVLVIRRLGILLVEDNANDELLTCHELHRQGISDITVVRDGAQALDYLFGRGQYDGREVTDQPVVVLLDLNLPKIGGLDVLKAIRADPRTTRLPVVIMTSSEEDVDIARGYDLGANSYIVKPVQFNEFNDRIRQLGLYWVLTNEVQGGPRRRIP